jgi:hypothetical protein
LDLWGHIWEAMGSEIEGDALNMQYGNRTQNVMAMDPKTKENCRG